MRNPPTLVSLAIDSALNHFSHISDLSFLPEHILLELFLRTLKAGKLNEKILKLFVATGKEEILSVIEALNIQHIMLPVLPTRKLFCDRLLLLAYDFGLSFVTSKFLSGCSGKF
ncbi:hypothetical protein DH2020_010678 [Rehmannia glutinosa]|uniref:Uncharacterized protein n=1 Tax=Rehmannia glutinosa TaxID=99300 RepID=A0ABR0XBA1_REHGL